MGRAGFNVQGCTIHRAFDIVVADSELAKNLLEKWRKELAAKLNCLLLLVIDT